MAYVQLQIDDDLQKDLKLNVSRLEQKTGLDYATLYDKLHDGGLSVDELKKDIDESGVSSEAMQQVSEDQAAKDILENAAVDVIRNTEKATLDKVAENTADITAARQQLGDGLASVGKQLADYAQQTNDSIMDFQTQIDQTHDAIDDANSKLSDLQSTVEGNTQQLRVMGQFMYSHASAQDRLAMLNSGYLKDSLSVMAWEALQEETAAQAKKDELVGDLNQVVGKFTQVCTIAKNLGFDPNGLQTAVTIADTASSVMSDLSGGNYLGAVVSLTGLFGSHPDPNAQLMSYMQKNFAEVNHKLDVLIQGEQDIMEGLQKLSIQMAAYDKALNERLDNVQYQLDAIQDFARMNFYEPLMGCQATQELIEKFIQQEQTIDPTIGLLDLTSPKQVAVVAENVGGTPVLSCINRLNELYTFAFQGPHRLGLCPARSPLLRKGQTNRLFNPSG